MQRIKQILMKRDNMSSQEANQLLAKAQEQFDKYLENNDLASVENVCKEFFGLGPEHLTEFY